LDNGEGIKKGRIKRTVIYEIPPIGKKEEAEKPAHARNLKATYIIKKKKKTPNTIRSRGKEMKRKRSSLEARIIIPIKRARGVFWDEREKDHAASDGNEETGTTSQTGLRTNPREATTLTSTKGTMPRERRRHRPLRETSVRCAGQRITHPRAKKKVKEMRRAASDNRRGKKARKRQID